MLEHRRAEGHDRKGAQRQQTLHLQRRDGGGAARDHRRHAPCGPGRDGDQNGLPVLQRMGVQRHPGHADEGHAHADQGRLGQTLAQDQKGEQGGEGDPQLVGHGHGADVRRQPIGRVGQAILDRPADNDDQHQALPVREGRPHEDDQTGGGDAEPDGADQQRRQLLRRQLGPGVVDAPHDDDRHNGSDLQPRQGVRPLGQGRGRRRNFGTDIGHDRPMARRTRRVGSL